MNKPFSNLMKGITFISVFLLLSGCGGNDEDTKLIDQINVDTPSTANPISKNPVASSAASSLVASSFGSSSRAAVLPSGKSSSSKPSSSVSSSSAVTALKDTIPPTAPASLKQTDIRNDGATISWAAATDNNKVTAYKVFRNKKQIAQVSGSTLKFTDTNMQANTVYDFTVQAGDAQGNWSAPSASLKLKTLMVSGDVVIEWFVPTARENGEYLEASEIGGYEIRYKLLSKDKYTSIVINDGEVDQYKLGYLVGDYEFQIATYDVNGLYSQFVEITPN